MFEVCRQEGAFSHTPEDFEDIYADKIECCQAEISKIQKNRSTSHNLRIEMQKDGIHI